MTKDNMEKLIELPELKTAKFNLLSADIEIVKDPNELSIPNLLLEGEEDAFEHTFVNGKLFVKENSQSNVIVNSGRGMGSVIIGNSTGSVFINGINITAENGVYINTARRKAKLSLPLGRLATLEIISMSADSIIDDVGISIISVSTKSGDIALSNTWADTLSLITMSGDIDIEDSGSANIVNASTMSGDIDVSSSKAPEWGLSSMSGDIKVKKTQGIVNASTMSGRSRIS